MHVNKVMKYGRILLLRKSIEKETRILTEPLKA